MPRKAARGRREGRWRRVSWLAAAACALVLGSVAAAQDRLPTPPAVPATDVLRDAAGVLAELGRSEANGAILVAALALLVEGGASVTPGDPFGGDLLEAEARAAVAQYGSGGWFGLALDRIDAQPRGVTGGSSRIDLRLDPGEEISLTLTFAGGEPAFVEALLRRGSASADIDLAVTAESGAKLAEAVGPATGIEGFRAFAEWRPEDCAEVTVTLVNLGTEPAEVLFLAPQAAASEC